MSKSSDAAPSVRYRDLFARREFSALVFAQIVSGLGDQVARIAIALLVLDRTNSASLSAATFALSYIPLVFGGTLLGPLADRFARHKVLLASDALRLMVVGLLAVLANDSSPLILLFVLLFVAELFTPVFDAAWAATLPEVLPVGREYLAGSGLLRTLHLLQQVAGLALGGLAVAVLQVQGALIVDAISFAVSFVVLALFLRRRPAPAADRPRAGLLSDFTDGARDLFSDPSRRILVLVGWGSV
ncbi:MAG: MFS transporter, partial [Actinobacteria bacterium]|nr:MFS transporter [Actinomycetota bacterium]